MKDFRISALAVALTVIAVAAPSYAQQYPKATGYVNDFANLLTHEQGASLNDELIVFEKKTTIEIAVVTTNAATIAPVTPIEATTIVP